MSEAEDLARQLWASKDAADHERAARLEVLIALGEQTAAVAASQLRGHRLTDTLSPLPSTATDLNVDGAHAIHFLRRRQGSLFGGFDYCARIDLPGVLPAFLLLGGFGHDDDASSFGPRQRLQHEQLGRLLTARTRAPDVLRAFSSDAIAAGFPTTSTRVALVRHSATLSVLEVDVDVGDATRCDDAAGKAVQLGLVALALVRNNAIFAERAVDTRPPAEQLESLLSVLSSSTSWLSGPVARVGDGVEARLELDEQTELPCALRLDVHGVTGLVTLFLRAPLKTSPPQTTTLSPQHGFFDKVRGLVDVKVGETAFDAAWIISGDRDDASVLRTAEGELAALRKVDASIEWGAEGLVVRAPGFELDDLVDAVDAGLRLWRFVVRQSHGLDEAMTR